MNILMRMVNTFVWSREVKEDLPDAPWVLAFAGVVAVAIVVLVNRKRPRRP